MEGVSYGYLGHFGVLLFTSWRHMERCIFEFGWKSFKVYDIRQKGPSAYCNVFLPYILIPIKINESKVVKIFRRIIF
jgi:hypothetical protein